ncbi:DUF1684 domain-containing protein [Xylanimonas ulmi]|uniref:DUF1684 domain-containing protein n=1 Tax=Xylanimonas ulmi TaxID=228973 RepID=A0A4Q7LYM6_9MICO|nr:DUF1684 domain-containing protein [Xylanibacterium ulmi]RZS59791.1 hypothetical protein EV386_0027 [Xylanibacterium ulmi]
MSRWGTRETTDEQYVAQWRDWYGEAEAALTEPYGFLAMTGLTWLDADPTRIAGVPGLWWVEGGHVVADLDAGQSLHVGTEQVAGRVRVPLDSPTRIFHGSVWIDVVHRTEGVYVRPRDPDNPRRLTYPGTPTYDLDPAWRLQGRWTPPARPGRVALPSSLAGVTNHYGDAGTLDLDIAGRTWRLTLISTARVAARLIFRDTTNGVETYPRGRHIDLDLPEGSDVMTVDFNRARNFWCAYSPQPTCPAAPPQNVLDVAVPVGARYPS